jgi:DNA-binding beta-propeller fold protein YncE
MPSTLTGGQVRFGNAGTKIYVLNISSDTILQYDLSTAWDISSAAYASKSFSVATQADTPAGIAFSSDGTKLYVTDEFTKSAYQYTLSTAWDISTASYDSKSLAPLASERWCAMNFKADGTTLYLTSETDLSADKHVRQFTCSTPWDISTATDTGKAISYLADLPGSPLSSTIRLSSDGTQLLLFGFVFSGDFARVVQYTLSTPFDISTATNDGTFAGISTLGLFINGFDVTESDDKLIVFEGGGLNVIGNSLREVVLHREPQAVQYAYVVDYFRGYIVQLSLPSAWTLSNATVIGLLYSQGQDTNMQGFDFSPDGTAIYAVGIGNTTIYQYSLSTPWMVESGSYTGKSLSVGAQDSLPRGLALKPDGTELFVAGATNTRIFKYTFGTAFDLATASYASDFYSATAQGTRLHDVTIKSDGATMYTLRNGTTDAVYQYSLSTAWLPSSASYTSKSRTVGAQTSAPVGHDFGNGGARLIVVDERVAYQYTLSTAWDLATATYDSIAALHGAPFATGFRFGPLL